MSQQPQQEWTPEQKLFIEFVAAGKKDTQGKKWTMEEFAERVLKLERTTLWRWKKLPGFAQAVFEEKLTRNLDYLPAMVDAQTAKAIKQGDTAAFKEMLRAMELLKADKSENNNITEV